MSIYNNNNKFVSYLIILASLFILVLFTKDKVQSINENLDLKETYTNTLKESKTKLTELNNLKNSLASSQENLDKYNVVINEDEMIDYIYSSIEKTNGRNGITTIKNVDISEPAETELWFKESLINLSLRIPNEEKLKQILDVFTSKDNRYNFIVTSFTFPYGSTEWNFSVTIPLKILHN